jgi:hypothetical protein
MDRTPKSLLLLLALPLVACGDDATSPIGDGSTGGEDSSTGTPVTITMPTSVTDTDPTVDDSGTDDTGATDTGMTDTGMTDTGMTDTGMTDTGMTDTGTTDGGAVCGDAMVDGTEECDSDDLAGETCDSLGLGFAGGTLSCAADCTFDTSACTPCGNDMIDGPEACDGVDLGGQTCAGLGFVDGPLACDAMCAFDTSGCSSCGDDVVDAGESCDGANLDGNDCSTIGMGFAGGTLACDASCGFDTAGCNTCGNGSIEAPEACDGADLGGLGCIDLGMGFTAGNLGCDAACGYDVTGCSNVPWPVAGEVIVTEIMQNPSVLADADGEYFEIHNTTGGFLQLANCVFEGATDTGFTVDVDLQIGPGQYVTFAVPSAVGPGFAPDYVWPMGTFGLTNTSDLVRLTCNGVIVDEVAYDDGATFPDPNGQSMNLDPGSFDAVANDVGANWCESTTSYNGDFGTPGAANDMCGGPVTWPVDFCRLQFPTIIDETEGTLVDVFGRLYIAGLTDMSGVNDPAPSVFGSVGWGPDGTDPAIDPGWTWTSGAPNPGYGPASPGYEANNDEYMATLAVPSPPGTYDFAFRFSGDNGTTFTYCDTGAGSSDGYAAADAGQMTSQPGGPPPNLYISEYAEGSSNNKALEIYNPPGADADLTACELRFYFNGGVAAGNTINLAGVLPADDVLVVCDDNIDPLVFAGCDVLAAGSFFNGDDAIELVCSGTTLDVIGQIGLDPGDEWNVGGVGTQNETLRRSCAVTAGDSNGADAFDPSLEWATFPLDEFSDFGQYICP